MKKILLLPIAAFFFACSGDTPKTNNATGSSEEIERATLACWSQNWSDQKGYDISEGLNLLDDYLFKIGMLGKRTVADYKRVLTSNQVIVIPDSIPGADKIRLALNSDYGGNPNVAGMNACWKQNWFDKLNTLDSNDVVCRLGKLVKDLGEKGPPDIDDAANRFFTGLTDADMQRQLIKNISYFIFWKTRSGETHIIVAKPDQVAVDSMPKVK